MLVLFATPYLGESPLRFLRALAELGTARIGVISHDPAERLDLPVEGHWRVDDVLDPVALDRAVEGLERRLGRTSQLLTVNEQILVAAAQVRERRGIPGMKVEAARNFRDKDRMKELFRRHGIPCARSCKAAGPDEVWRFVEEVGLPICLKPLDGAAAQSTYRIDTHARLGEILAASPPSPGRPLQVEEFITGEEASFETLSLEGRPRWHSSTRYLPTPLDVMQNPWIQWRVLLPREVDDPAGEDVRQHGRRALEALGMETGVSHMEWFRRPDGGFALSEIGARPPGAQLFTLINRAHDIDMFRIWAELMVSGRFTPPPARRHACGVAFVRGMGRGRVRAVRGWEAALAELGPLVTDQRRPQPGQPASPSYEGEGYVVVRHPTTAVVEAALLHVIETVRVELER